RVSRRGRKALAQIVWIEPEDVADADKATQPGRVILHDPLLGLMKQPLAPPPGSRGIFHVGIHGVLQHSPEQTTLWLIVDALGHRRRRCRQRGGRGKINHFCSVSHTSIPICFSEAHLSPGSLDLKVFPVSRRARADTQSTYPVLYQNPRGTEKKRAKGRGSLRVTDS